MEHPNPEGRCLYSQVFVDSYSDSFPLVTGEITCHDKNGGLRFEQTVTVQGEPLTAY